MATYGITENGFVRKPLTQIITDLENKAKEEFGYDANTDNDSFLSHSLATVGNQFDELWQALQGTYSAQTISGAEGYDLDNILSLQGVYRQGKRKGSGVVHLLTDGNLPNNKLINSNTNFQAGSLVYNVTDNFIINDTNVSSYMITSDIIILNISYTLSVVNTSTGLIETTSAETPSNLTEVKTMFDNWVNHVVSNKPELSGKVWSDSDNSGKCLWALGYSYSALSNQTKRTYTINPLSTPIYLKLDPDYGTRGTDIPVEAKEAGRQVVLGGGTAVLEGSTLLIYTGELGDLETTQPSGSINKVIPSFTGLVAPLSINRFNSGAEQETDAEYIFRYNQIIDRVTASTRDAVEGAVLSLDNVQKVRIYENVTASNTTEADAYSFNTVVFGGNATDITQTIYEKKPINVNTSGTTTLNVTTSSGSVEPISFSFASEIPIDIRISYATKSGFNLTSTEQTAITDALADFGSNTDIGDIIYNDQIKSYVFGALPFGRLTSLTVEVKKGSQADSSYSSNDYVSDFDEIPTIVAEDIFFVPL